MGGSEAGYPERLWQVVTLRTVLLTFTRFWLAAELVAGWAGRLLAVLPSWVYLRLAGQNANDKHSLDSAWLLGWLAGWRLTIVLAACVDPRLAA